MPDDVKELVREEIEAKCKEKEEILWKNGKNAFGAVQREVRETESEMMKKMALLEEDLALALNDQKVLRSMFMDINNRVENMSTSRAASKKAYSDSTKTAKSTTSSEQDDVDKSELPYETMQKLYAQSYLTHEQADDEKLRSSDSPSTPESNYYSSDEKSWEQWMEEWGFGAKDGNSAWPSATTENSTLPSGTSGWNSDPWAASHWPYKVSSDWTGYITKGAAHAAAVHNGAAPWTGVKKRGYPTSSLPLESWKSYLAGEHGANPLVRSLPQQHPWAKSQPHGNRGTMGSQSDGGVQRQGSMPTDQWQPMEITLVRSGDATSLGTDVNDQPDGTLSVETILPGGLVWKYNETQAHIHGQKVSIGDRISVVNGKKDPASMLAECKSCAKLNLVVLHRNTASEVMSTMGILRAEARPFEPYG